MLIDPFEVPAGEDDAFLAGWDDARAVLAAAGLPRRPPAPRDRSADFRFIDLAASSPLMVQRAASRAPRPFDPGANGLVIGAMRTMASAS